jgi:hypothetical protein
METNDDWNNKKLIIMKDKAYILDFNLLSEQNLL